MLTYPGVYVVEVEQTAKPIEGVSTSVNDVTLWSVVRELRNRLPDFTPTPINNESDPSVALLEIFSWITELLISRLEQTERAIPYASRLVAGALALISTNNEVLPCGVLKCVRFFPKPLGRSNSKPSIPYLAVGFVISSDDPEQKRRVLINCPSISSDAVWARIVKPLVSDADVLLPDTGDEVLVAFEPGSFSSPYVIGSLWGDGSPPESTSHT